MFLAELEDTRKELFLDLSLHLSMCDKEFADTEKKVIQQMCKEMEIKERFEPVNDFDSAINQLVKGATVREKRIVLLEIGGIILADGVFSLEEENAMKKIADALDIDFFQCEHVISMVRDLYEVYSKIGLFISSR